MRQEETAPSPIGCESPVCGRRARYTGIMRQEDTDVVLQKKRVAAFSRAFFLVVISAALGTISAPSLAHAFVGSTGIAKTDLVSGGTPVSGDIVVFNPNTRNYRLARKVADPSLYGVVVASPLLVLEDSKSGGVPIVTSGEAYVNVTALSGPIHVGDYVTSSSIPGVGGLASSTDAYIVGTALEPFSGASTTSAFQAIPGSTPEGSILVLLSIGPRPAAPNLSASQTPLPVSSRTASSMVLQVIRYVLAALITVGSIYAAFRNFGSNITSSIVSVGRNPLAKTSIQFMMLLNAALIVLVSVAGIALSLVVLFAPL